MYPMHFKIILSPGIQPLIKKTTLESALNLLELLKSSTTTNRALVCGKLALLYIWGRVYKVIGYGVFGDIDIDYSRAKFKVFGGGFWQISLLDNSYRTFKDCLKVLDFEGFVNEYAIQKLPAFLLKLIYSKGQVIPFIKAIIIE